MEFSHYGSSKKNIAILMNNYIWTNIIKTENSISIPLYLDKNYLRIKQIYLDFIYELSQQEIGNKTIIDILKNK